MVSLETDNIDFSKLESELYCSIEADKKYKRENDAKFRAVAQNVATYEEFVEIVKASHLKPLEKNDFKKKSEIRSEQLLSKKVTYDNFGFHSEPKTIQEFERSWKLLKYGEDRFRLLKDYRHLIKKHSFCDNLGDFLIVLTEFQDTFEDLRFVIEFLEYLSHVQRFGLCLQFLTDREKDSLRQLFTKLQNKTREFLSQETNYASKVRELKGIYQVETHEQEYTSAI